MMQLELVTIQLAGAGMQDGGEGGTVSETRKGVQECMTEGIFPAGS